jgi:glycogen operon protein
MPSTTGSIPANPRRYLNFTGTGNSFNSAHRVVLALIMDSLRYWVEEMHVDGFRFDLAATLARNASHAFDRNGRLPLGAAPGPVLSQVKLIAEPWDVAEGGYQLGNFPPGWANGTTSTATRCARTGRARAA